MHSFGAVQAIAGDKDVHTFIKGMSRKVNVIARMEFELASYNVTVHLINYYATRNFPLWVYLSVLNIPDYCSSFFFCLLFHSNSSNAFLLALSFTI